MARAIKADRSIHLVGRIPRRLIIFCIYSSNCLCSYVLNLTPPMHSHTHKLLFMAEYNPQSYGVYFINYNLYGYLAALHRVPSAQANILFIFLSRQWSDSAAAPAIIDDVKEKILICLEIIIVWRRPSHGNYGASKWT